VIIRTVLRNPFRKPIPAGTIYRVTDDSGMLALIDPAAYRSFVGDEWTLDALEERFREESSARRMILWGTGREGEWSVRVRFERSAERGFREFETGLRVSEDRLLLTNYEALSMAAQFEDVKLPEPHDQQNGFGVPGGHYACRVIQHHDPDGSGRTDKNGPDFTIDLIKVSVPSAEGAILPWSPFTKRP